MAEPLPKGEAGRMEWVDEAFRLMQQAANILYVRLEQTFPPGSKVVCFINHNQKKLSHGRVVGANVDGRITIELDSGNVKRVNYKRVRLAPDKKNANLRDVRESTMAADRSG